MSLSFETQFFAEQWEEARCRSIEPPVILELIPAVRRRNPYLGIKLMKMEGLFSNLKTATGKY